MNDNQKINQNNGFNIPNNLNNNMPGNAPTNLPNDNNNITSMNNNINFQPNGIPTNNNIQENSFMNLQNNNMYINNDISNQTNNLSINNIKENQTLNIQKNNKKIIIIVGIIILLLIGVIIFTQKGNSRNGAKNNGYTAKVGETLEIDEKYHIFNIKALGPLEKYEPNTVDSYVRLKVSIKNLTTETMKLSPLETITIVDSKKNILYESHSLSTSEGSIFLKDIASGETLEGYIYFYSYFDDNEANYVTDYNRMNDIKYLNINIIGNYKTVDGKIGGDYVDYYLTLQ